ncbi:MAG: hypothetical protein Q3976_09165 [Corynebacterium sp.]|nr:hypothetical protein [Corynebacterium sp.]
MFTQKLLRVFIFVIVSYLLYLSMVVILAGVIGMALNMWSAALVAFFCGFVGFAVQREVNYRFLQRRGSRD